MTQLSGCFKEKFRQCQVLPTGTSKRKLASPLGKIVSGIYLLKLDDAYYKIQQFLSGYILKGNVYKKSTKNPLLAQAYS